MMQVNILLIVNQLFQAVHKLCLPGDNPRRENSYVCVCVCTYVQLANHSFVTLTKSVGVLTITNSLITGYYSSHDILIQLHLLT